MSFLGTNPAEMEGSGQRRRLLTGSEGTLEEGTAQALSAPAKTVSQRLRRQIAHVVRALATLTQSGRLARIITDDHLRNELEDSREMVSLSLDAFSDGLLCVGGMAASLKGSWKNPGKNPYELVEEIIDHTIRQLVDHPFFRETGTGPKDTVLIEEAENAIVVHARGPERYQKIACADLFVIPEHLKPHLDEVVTMWSHFFGKQYDIACFYEKEVFEKLEDLKERAKPLNRLFGGIIRAFDDAIDAARAEYEQALEKCEETKIEKEPAIDEAVEAAEPLPAKKTHGISQPFFPPPSLDQVYEELLPSEQRLVEMDVQFNGLVAELLGSLKAQLRGAEAPASQHFVDLMPEALLPEHRRLDRIYRDIVPGSMLHLLNPRTFLLTLLQKGIEQGKEKGGWKMANYRGKKLREVIVEANPGGRFLEQLAELLPKAKTERSDDAQAAEICSQFGRLAELATSALFPRSSSLGNIATSEVLCHEHLIRPEKPFSFEDRIANSPLLRGEKPSTEDKLCRLLIGLVQALQGREGLKAEGISGVFMLITGNFHEGKRWIKTNAEEEPFMQQRCRWLQGVFEKFFEEEEIQTLGRALFGLLQNKTKQQWDGTAQGMSVFRLVRHQAKKITWDEAEAARFCAAYDAMFSGLEQTVGEFLEGEKGEERLADVAWGIHAYWHKSLLALLPIVTGLLRADTRLRGQLTSVGSVRSFELTGLNGPQVIPFLRKEEQKGKIVLPSVNSEGVSPYFLTVRRRRKSAQ